MCGIVGHIGASNTKSILLNGLKELEYRGYDSAGIAILQDGDIEVYKAVGKIKNLEKKVNASAKPNSSDEFIKTKKTDHCMLEFFEMLVALQLLSMEISVKLENDVDMPRNLAKSVTVE